MQGAAVVATVRLQTPVRSTHLDARLGQTSAAAAFDDGAAHGLTFTGRDEWGVQDLAAQVDHYAYGLPKRST